VPAPALIAHADWSAKPQKRQVAVAELTADGHYRVVSLAPAQSLEDMKGDLRVGLNVADLGTGQLWAGFGFPIGFPRAYAERARISFFPDFLPLIGHEPWQRFAEIAPTSDEVCLHRPFFPARPGPDALPSHLQEGLGLTHDQLRRRCDGNDSETMFWTLGAKHVGRATLDGWSYLSAVPPERIRYWPFHGPLTTLLNGDVDTVVATETYPREFYQYFRTSFNGKGSKRKREDRLNWVADLLHWANAFGVEWQEEVGQRVSAGFADDIIGEDEFDATVGLLGMIGVVTGAMESGDPTDDPAVTRVEGWILGRPADRAVSTSRLEATNEAWNKLAAMPQEEQRASIEATVGRLVAFARDVGYSDDELMNLVARNLGDG
jgi:hypothetical protein